MAEELNRKLMKRIADFAKEKKYPIEKESTAVASLVNELLSAARKSGGDQGKREAVDFLQSVLEKADNLCDNNQFDEICALMEAAERFIQEGGQ